MSKKVSFKEKHVAGPPSGSRWVWHTADMRNTEKWLRMPLTCRRLLDRIELEHMAHNGQENGRLNVAYSQFVQWNISRRSIPAAIRYAENAGFLEVMKRGYHVKDTTNEYRLTYLATRERVRGVYEWSAPTNEWKQRAGKSFFSRAGSDTPLGQKVTLSNISSASGPSAAGARAAAASPPPPTLPVPPPGSQRLPKPTLDPAEKIGAATGSIVNSALNGEGSTLARAGGRGR